jgi:hypothetical protein
METKVKEEKNIQKNNAPPPRPHAAMKRLDPLIGTWDIAGHANGAEGEIYGRTNFEWIVSGFFMVQRFWMNFMGQKVQGIEVIGYDPTTKTFKSTVYSNSGINGPYYWDVKENVISHWTEGSQFRGQLNADGNILSGGWKPDKGKESETNIAYEATMTRVE